MYIAEVISEEKNHRVPNQLVTLPKNTKKKNDEKISKSSDEMDEMSVASNIAGFTAPLGASNLDMGENPVKQGKKLKKRKKSFVRWK